MKAPESGDDMESRGRVRRSSRRAALCAATLAVLAGSGEAARLDYQLEADLLHSDNIARNEFDEIDETVVTPRLIFDLTQEGSAVKARALGQAEYRHYIDNSFSDEMRGDFAGQLNWTALPERLSLVLEDYLSEEPIDFRDADTPGNRQQVNVLIAGATLKARLAPATHAQLDLRAADSYAEETEDFNGNRYGAGVSLTHAFRPTIRGSLNLIGADVNFDDAVGSADYTRQDAFVRYEQDLADGNVEVDLGHSRINPDGSGSRPSTTLARGTLSWRATARSELRLRASHQFADAVQDLTLRQSDFDEPLILDLAEPDVLVSSGVYRQRNYDLQYRYRGDRVTLRVRPRYQQNRYLDEPADDRNVRGGAIRLDYRSRPRLTFSGEALARDRDYLSDTREDRDREYSIGAEYRMTRHWSWRAEAIHSKRDSTLPDSSYTENAVRFTVAWSR